MNEPPFQPWSAEDEREAILEMLRSMHPDVSPDAIDGYHALDVLEVIIDLVQKCKHYQDPEAA